MPEEKKIDNVVEEEESDFADETKLEEIKPVNRFQRIAICQAK